jgi:hypothetical protein
MRCQTDEASARKTPTHSIHLCVRRETKASLDEGEVDAHQENRSPVRWVLRGMPPMPPRHTRLDLPRYRWVPGGLQLGDQPEGRNAPSFISYERAPPMLPSALAPQQARWACDETVPFVPPPPLAPRIPDPAATVVADESASRAPSHASSEGPRTSRALGLNILGRE